MNAPNVPADGVASPAALKAQSRLENFDVVKICRLLLRFQIVPVPLPQGVNVRDPHAGRGKTVNSSVLPLLVRLEVDLVELDLGLPLVQVRVETGLWSRPGALQRNQLLEMGIEGVFAELLIRQRVQVRRRPVLVPDLFPALPRFFVWQCRMSCTSFLNRGFTGFSRMVILDAALT